MQFLAATLKTTEWSQFVSKANHSTFQQSKSMPQAPTPKKLKVIRRPRRPPRTNTKNRCPFHYKGLECKSRKSRDTWSNRQVWPWSTKWSRAKRLTDFSQDNSLVIANTLFQQHKRTLYTWTSPNGQYWNQIDYGVAEDGKAVYSQQKQDRELTVAQIISSS